MHRAGKYLQILITSLFLGILWMHSNDLYAQKTKVACVGNSVTFGYKIDQPGINSYPAQLQQLLGDSYEVGNFGKSGATLLRKGHRPYMEQDEFKAAVDFKPDILIVSLGLNDTDPRNWPNYRDEFIADYMALISQIKKSDGTKPELYIGRMTPIFHWHPRFLSGTRDWFWQIQETIEQVAVNCNARLIDWHTPLHQRPDLLPDALHPNKEGASIMAQLAYQHLTGDFGGLKVAEVFGHHMVLQRESHIPVWGTANRGDEITVELNGETCKAIAGDDGCWKVQLPPMPHGGPYELKVSSYSDEVLFKDVLLGEVWLCAGQSNMAFELKSSHKGAHSLQEAMPAQVRLMHYKQSAITNAKAWSKQTLTQLNNLEYLSGQWAEASAETAADFSALAWYFGKSINQELDVPVGLIQMAVGGSPTEAWIDRKTIEFHPQLVNMLYDWPNNDHSMQWCRQRASHNIKKAENARQRHPYQPAYLYEAGITQVAGYGIKGILWYQGESNAHNVELHEVLFPTLIESMRQAWGKADLPFYFAQLSSLNRPSWPHFRDSQRRMASQIPNVSMVVTSDVGHPTDVHPKQKKQVGERLAYAALHELYNNTSVPYGNVEIEKVNWSQDLVSITFNHTDYLQTADDDIVKELEVGRLDGLYYPVEAKLEGNKLIIATGGQVVRAVRYGWKAFSLGNLLNEDGIPVSTFIVNNPDVSQFKREVSQ